MRILAKLAMAYGMLGLGAGVFYREFTKYMAYDGNTSLSVVHTHLLTLGMIFVLIVLILEKQFRLSTERSYKRFFVLYNIGLPLTVVMLIVRGILQVSEATLSKGLDASISGMAGIGHGLLGVGLFFFLRALIIKVSKEE